MYQPPPIAPTVDSSDSAISSGTSQPGSHARSDALAVYGVLLGCAHTVLISRPLRWALNAATPRSTTGTPAVW